MAGLDGAAWHLVDPLIDEGVMPRLAALRARGASGSLRSTVPPVTPPAWTSAATGVNPGRHGVYGFYVGHAQHERRELMHSGLVHSPTIWEVANAQGARVGVFNVPLTYPPVEVDGWMVAGMMTPGYGHRLEGYVLPRALEDAIAARVPDYIIEMNANWEQDWRDESLAERALASIEQRHAVLELLLTEHPTDIVFAVLEAPDRLQHVYYRYMDPADPLYATSAAARVRPAVARCFAALDRTIGMLEDFAGTDGCVVVCSDHGFTAWEVSVHTNFLLESWGYLKLKRRARAMQSSVARAVVPVAKRFLPTRVRRGAKVRTLAVIDWARTRAFASPDYLQGVFVNVEGREPLGIVKPAELDALKNDIAARFETLRDPDGRPVTERVWRSEEVYGPDALPGAPDLLPVLRDHRHLPRGVHHPDGIVILGGTGISPNSDVRAGITDVTPTLLYMSGLAVPEGLDGSVMTSAFDDSHLRAHPVAAMAPLGARPRAQDSPYSAEEEEAIAESLRGLGYL